MPHLKRIDQVKTKLKIVNCNAQQRTKPITIGQLSDS